jgi:hypothetical protein
VQAVVWFVFYVLANLISSYAVQGASGSVGRPRPSLSIDAQLAKQLQQELAAHDSEDVGHLPLDTVLAVLTAAGIDVTALDLRSQRRKSSMLRRNSADSAGTTTVAWKMLLATHTCTAEKATPATVTSRSAAKVRESLLIRTQLLCKERNNVQTPVQLLAAALAQSCKENAVAPAGSLSVAEVAQALAAVGAPLSESDVTTLATAASPTACHDSSDSHAINVADLMSYLRTGRARRPSSISKEAHASTAVLQQQDSSQSTTPPVTPAAALQQHSTFNSNTALDLNDSDEVLLDRTGEAIKLYHSSYPEDTAASTAVAAVQSKGTFTPPSLLLTAALPHSGGTTALSSGRSTCRGELHCEDPACTHRARCSAALKKLDAISARLCNGHAVTISDLDDLRHALRRAAPPLASPSMERIATAVTAAAAAAEAEVDDYSLLLLSGSGRSRAESVTSAAAAAAARLQGAVSAAAKRGDVAVLQVNADSYTAAVIEICSTDTQLFQ